MSKIGFITLGCKVNIYESNAIKDKFIELGYEVGDATSDCDAFIINTCSVTNMADSKSRQMIRKCIKLNPNAIICAMGCYVQSNDAEAKEIEGVDILLGNSNKGDAVEKIDSMLKNKKKERYVNIMDILHNKDYEPLTATMFDHTRAFVKIEDGCQNFCSYCVIPYARGPVRSKPLMLTLRELKDIANLGYKEVVLSGIDIGKYYDKDTNTNFSKLVKLIIDTIPDIKRIRISSIEITQINDEFIELLKNNQVIASHIHLPLQSGSDIVLKDMNRKYDTSKFLEIANKLREARPDISLTTDVIVGFPTETDEEYNNSVDFIKKINFSKLHVFPYSMRKNTKAALMKQLPDNVKKDRTSKLIRVSSELEKDYYLKFIGETMSVIFEQSNDNYTIGHTSNYLEIRVLKDDSLIGNLVDVKLLSYENGVINGEIIKK